MAAKDSVSIDTLANGFEGPLYIRKLTRKSHWGIDSDEIEHRLKTSILEVFSDEGDVYSFFKVCSTSDIFKAAIGFNSRRSRLNEQLDVIAFTQSEFDRAGVVTNATPGDTNCDCANANHVDVTASSEVLRQLCTAAMENRREAFRFSRTLMSEIVSELQTCRAISTAAECFHA